MGRHTPPPLRMALLIGSKVCALSTSSVLIAWTMQSSLLATGINGQSVSLFLLGWLLFGAELGNAVGLMLWGPLGSVFNRRSLAIVGSLVSAVLLLVLAAVPLSIAAFGVVLFLNGLVNPIEGFVRPWLARVLAARTEDAEQRERRDALVQGWMSMMIPIGFVVFRTVVLVGSWQLGFTTTAGLMVVFGLALLLLPDDVDKPGPAPTARNAWSVMRGAWADMVVEARSPLVLLPTAIALLGGLAFKAPFAIQPDLLNEHVPAGIADLWFVAFQGTNILAAIACLFWSRLVVRRPGMTMIVSNTLLLPAIVAVPLITWYVDGSAWVVAFLLASAAADVTTNIAMINVFDVATKARNPSAAFAVILAGRVLSMALGALFGPILKATIGAQGLFLACVAPAAVNVVLAIVFVRRYEHYRRLAAAAPATRARRRGRHVVRTLLAVTVLAAAYWRPPIAQVEAPLVGVLLGVAAALARTAWQQFRAGAGAVVESWRADAVCFGVFGLSIGVLARMSEWSLPRELLVVTIAVLAACALCLWIERQGSSERVVLGSRVRRVPRTQLASFVTAINLNAALYVFGALGKQVVDLGLTHESDAARLYPLASIGVAVGCALIVPVRRWDARHVAWWAGVGGTLTLVLGVVVPSFAGSGDAKLSSLLWLALIGGGYGISFVVMTPYVLFHCVSDDERERVSNLYTTRWGVTVGALLLGEWAAAQVFGMWNVLLGVALLTMLASPFVRLLEPDFRDRVREPLVRTWLSTFEPLLRPRTNRLTLLGVAVSAVGGASLAQFYGTLELLLRGASASSWATGSSIASFLGAMVVLELVRTRLPQRSVMWLAAALLTGPYAIALLLLVTGHLGGGWIVILIAFGVELGSTLYSARAPSLLLRKDRAEAGVALQNVAKYGIGGAIGLFLAPVMKRAAENGGTGIEAILWFNLALGAVGFLLAWIWDRWSTRGAGTTAVVPAAPPVNPSPMLASA